MHSFFIRCLLVVLLNTFSSSIFAQGLYELNTIQKIEITFTQANWDYQMDTAKYGAEEYLMAAAVKINGISYDSVGVKYKGNSSYDSTRIKNPLHIEFDAFKEQKHNGYTDIKLSNAYSDPSMIREVLAYQILKNYMHCPLSNFAQLYINGNYIGLYSSSENIDKNFCADHFYSSQNTFIKCNPTVAPGPTTKSNLRYVNNDSNSYELYYEVKSDYGWNDLVSLCDTISNHTGSIDNILDMDRFTWMLAFNNAFVNLDSYNGVFAQNHYVYKDVTQHYNPILWDLNMCFGGFPFAGAGATSMGSLTTIGMTQLSPNHHATDAYWPLIQAVHANPTYKRKYIAHMRTIINENIASGNYVTLANQLRAIIDTAVLSDNHKFFTNSQYVNGLDSLTDVGSYDVPGIVSLMSARLSYLQSTAEFIAVPPTISSVNPNVASPAYNSAVTINATIMNATANGVSLGYRFNKTLKFTKVQMFDDGAHNDGGANDNIFGADILMSGGQMEYYVYAENNDAGVFSPQRAEHEFYTLMANSIAPLSGELVINEFLADNINQQRDEYGNTEDWLELYNNSSKLLNLSDVYLSDKLSNLTKWKFPTNTTIAPQSYMIIWTDDDSSQQILHTNFSLNKDSGSLFLSNATNILDSISFGAQTSNVSFGRYPNGTGGFISMAMTFGAWNNNYPQEVKNISKSSFNIYPNPANQFVNLTFEGEKTISLLNIQGQLLARYKGNNSLKIPTFNLKEGLYIIQCGSSRSKLLIQK